MSQSHRLPSGGLIDRAKPLSFQFDGKTYQGFARQGLHKARQLLRARSARVARRSAIRQAHSALPILR